MIDTGISIEEQIACVQREIKRRGRSYGRLVKDNKMTKRAAVHEIKLMNAVLQTLNKCRFDEMRSLPNRRGDEKK